MTTLIKPSHPLFEASKVEAVEMANPVRLALSDPRGSLPPRYVVAGQAGAASGDVRLFEWRRSVR